MNNRKNINKTKLLTAVAALLILAVFLTWLLLYFLNEKTISVQNNEKLFVDDCGRTEYLPYDIERIAVTGPMAQFMCFSLCPDEMVEFASEWEEAAFPYIGEKYREIPVLGKLYVDEELNVEELINLRPQLIIDCGEQKDTIVEDMNRLSEVTGIPCVHIDAYFENMPEAYARLGELLGKEDEASKLSDYLENIYITCGEAADASGRKTVLYLSGADGLNVLPAGTYASECIDYIATNVAIIDSPSSKGTGNNVNAEQILNWNPECIIFATGSEGPAAINEEVLGQLDAVKNGRCYEVPLSPYNWVASPSALQRHLALLWYTYVLYSDTAGFDLYEEVSGYMKLFYHFNLDKETFESWMHTN